MEHRIFGQFEVRREELLLELFDVSALVVALHALRCIQNDESMWRFKTRGNARILFIQLREQLCQQRI